MNMADEQSTTELDKPLEKAADKPAVSDLAAQLASGIANKPLGPASGSAAPSGQGDRGPRENRPPREARPPREGGRPPGQGGGKPGGERREGGPREGGPRPEGRREGGRPEGRPGEGRPGGDRGPRPGGGRFDFPQDIDLEKLINDSLYLDNQAHVVVSRMRDLDSGTRSTLRRLYNAVRRATRTPENERQHAFVMLRARLAYTIARHGLRSLDQIERLLLQVTRKNEARGYERFRDLFEAIVAYNE
jgi:CRISPR type III-A-associated protein Csm2